jgi:hypothetical protein
LVGGQNNVRSNHNSKAALLLLELEALILIKILDHPVQIEKIKFSEKYKGISSKQDGAKHSRRIQQMHAK